MVLVIRGAEDEEHSDTESNGQEDSDTESWDDEDSDMSSIDPVVHEIERLGGKIDEAAGIVTCCSQSALRLSELCRILANGFRSWEKCTLLDCILARDAPLQFSYFIIAGILFERQIERSRVPESASIAIAPQGFYTTSYSVYKRLEVSYISSSFFISF